ncbi:hypothetical protein LMG22037_05554 [Paraburkholderia phenoliruptrix]|jgi:type IV pilus biogenesis protein PilP|uniref:Type IV pilus biogenesis protein PilP n=1 Tax=Paraburkholderia phenoliruptrix TaxID=252970 RepID=A0A6J5CBM9_9BURK|nr:hypothetical protein [Paraburkholderia phenoliruptrix]CAB3730676.1 hypothetical protein LMG22037_05554 [Paraburkholderia phenoliruptrix]
MMKLSRALFVILMACLPLVTFAAPDSGASESGVSESDESTNLQKEAVRWKKLAEIARYKADVAAADERARKALTDEPAQGSSAAPTPAPAQATPPVQSIFHRDGFELHFTGAFNGHWEADMTVDGRRLPNVEVGDVVGNGWKVSAITDSNVELAKGSGVGRQTRVVGF